MDIIKIIRLAIINNTDRQGILLDISADCGCSRIKAKSMMFAFLYQATNDYLNNLLSNEEEL